MENNVIVTVIQKQDDEEQQVVYDGGAHYHENHLGKYIKYVENDGTITQIRFSDQLCWILRKGKYETKVLLHVNQESKIKICAEYGDFQFDAQLISIVGSENGWRVKYHLLQQEEVISVFEFTWLIKEALA